MNFCYSLALGLQLMAAVSEARKRCRRHAKRTETYVPPGPYYAIFTTSLVALLAACASLAWYFKRRRNGGKPVTDMEQPIALYDKDSLLDCGSRCVICQIDRKYEPEVRWAQEQRSRGSFNEKVEYMHKKLDQLLDAQEKTGFKDEDSEKENYGEWEWKANKTVNDRGDGAGVGRSYWNYRADVILDNRFKTDIALRTIEDEIEDIRGDFARLMNREGAKGAVIQALEDAISKVTTESTIQKKSGIVDKRFDETEMLTVYIDELVQLHGKLSNCHGLVSRLLSQTQRTETSERDITVRTACKRSEDEEQFQNEKRSITERSLILPDKKQYENILYDGYKGDDDTSDDSSCDNSVIREFLLEFI